MSVSYKYNTCFDEHKSEYSAFEETFSLIAACWQCNLIKVASWYHYKIRQVINIQQFYRIVCSWRDSPQWARASSFTRFLDHTHRRSTVGRTPLNEWSARRRDLYLTTHNTQQQTSQQASGRRPTPLTARSLGPAYRTVRFDILEFWPPRPEDHSTRPKSLSSMCSTYAIEDRMPSLQTGMKLALFTIWFVHCVINWSTLKTL